MYIYLYCVRRPGAYVSPYPEFYFFSGRFSCWQVKQEEEDDEREAGAGGCCYVYVFVNSIELGWWMSVVEDDTSDDGTERRPCYTCGWAAGSNPLVEHGRNDGHSRADAERHVAVGLPQGLEASGSNGADQDSPSQQKVIHAHSWCRGPGFCSVFGVEELPQEESQTCVPRDKLDHRNHFSSFRISSIFFFQNIFTSWGPFRPPIGFLPHRFPLSVHRRLFQRVGLFPSRV